MKESKFTVAWVVFLLLVPAQPMFSQETRDSAAAEPSVSLNGLVHIQNLGDLPLKDGEWAGTKGESLRFEGFQIDFIVAPRDLGLEYMCHIQDIGDTSWLGSGQFCGTRGSSRRIEGLAFRLVGPNSRKYDIRYECHLQDVGDIGPLADGFCGTRGQNRRLEAVRVWIVKSRSHFGSPHTGVAR